MTRLAWVLLVLAVFGGRAAAHPPTRTSVRELVRLQGHRDEAAKGTRFVLAALGKEQTFGASDFRIFALTEAPSPVAVPQRRFVLQGPRDVLARFTAARADQLVTILAEHRPGSPDLFVVALDLCPPR